MRIRQIMHFHDEPAVIDWWQNRLGRLLKAFTPIRRRAILAIAAVWVCIKSVGETLKTDSVPLPADGFGMALVVLMLFGISWFCYRVAADLKQLPPIVRRHPLWALHLSYWGLLVLLWVTVTPAGLWREVLVGVALFFPFLVWRYSYMLISGQYGKMAGTCFSDHLLTLWPVYGGSNTPYGKGYGYLSRFEAKDETELARSQLAGIRLLFLAVLWQIVLKTMKAVVYGPENALTQKLAGYSLGIPKLGNLINDGTGTSVWVAWVSVYCELIYQVLHHAIRGHHVIAMLRLFGFNVFRNTYKPLLAESVSEFWNRYYYYFKELLANFFFLPTFTQLGKRLRNWPQLRLFLAVFAAAFIGNMYYHIIQSEQQMVLGNVFDKMYSLRSRAFYCLLLAVGIYVSMRREQARGQQPPAPGLSRRIVRIAGVWTFFGLIFIWGVRGGASFLARVDFFFSLFGLS